MKALTVFLAAVLVILLAVFGILYFSGGNSEPAPESTAPTSQATEQPTTEAPTDAPTESTAEPVTEAPTQPEPVLTESGKVFIVNGVRMETFVADGGSTILVGAEEYLQALGLDEAGAGHPSHKARISLSADGLSLQVDGTVYGLVCSSKLYVPIYEVAEQLGYPAWVDDTYGGIYITPGAAPFELPGDVNVPVLMYHAVSDQCWGYDELFVSPSSMEAQLKYLTENGYDTIWFEDLAHIEDYDKPVILTFDDGYDDNYTELFPLLKKYNAKATIFVIGKDTVGIAHKLTEAQIRELSDSGLVSIQSHGYTHGDMDVMSEETLEYELSETKKVISRITGKVPYVLCYPTGKYSSTTLEVGRRHYNFGLKMVGGLYNTSDDPFLVSRYYIARSTDLSTFASYIAAAGS